ncbi:MAG TPA: hypothetical protein VJY35_01210, partial [Candidatus Eisenbacteria bacterium]|nr:hypothetical protein [Candidatus Eisenbacteria bacterium]
MACVATLATAPYAAAQFGPDFRLTGPPAFVSQTARSHAWSVAADDAGNVHVVYFDTRNAPDVPPWYRRFDRALNAWGPEVRVPSLAQANTRYVAIAADCFGQVHVVWVHTVAGDQHYLYYKKRSAAGAWGPDVLLQARTTDFWDIRDPVVTADYLGDVFVAWAEGLKNPQGDHVYNILYQANDAGGNTWTGPQGVTSYTSGVSPAPGARAPSVSAHERESGGGSIAHFAWADYPTGTVRYRAVRLVPNGGTSLRGTASLALGTSVAPPTVASRCDEVHVAWADPGSSTIVHRRGDMTFSIAETTAFAPAVPTGLTGQSPSIAVDGLGNVELVMLAGGAAKYARRSFMTGAWTAPVTVSDPPAVPNDPSIAVDTRGAVHVIWTDTRTVPTGTGGAYYDVGGCVALPAPALASRLEEDLSAALAAARPDERLPVLITLRDKPDMAALKRSVEAL